MNRHVRILVLDQDRYSAHMIETALAKRFRDGIIVVFDSARRAFEELTQNLYDTAILDYETLESDSTSEDDQQPTDAEQPSITFLDRLRAERHFLPLVVLTSSSGAASGGSGKRSLKISGAGVVECVPKDNSLCTTIPGVVENILARQPLDFDEFVPKWDDFAEVETASIVTAAGRLSHEVNNPLMTILGITELLLDNPGANGSEAIKKIRIIRKSAQRIVAALDRLSGKVRSKRKEFVSEIDG